MSGHVSSAWSRLGLQLRLQILIQGFLIVILVAAQFWILSQFEHHILSAAKERATAIADGVINGLNTLMITKAGAGKEVISDKKSRLQFKQKMAASDGIRELRVMRGKVIDEEYEEGLPEEYARDDLDRSVLQTGRTEYRMIVEGGDTTLRAVLPYVAKRNFRSINCMDCHAADEGEVVGATSLVIDINSDVATLRRINLMMWVGQGLLQVVLFFVIGAIVRKLLLQLGGEPRHVIEVIKQIARGNLSEQIATRPGDETSLLAAMKSMQRDLRVVVQDIQAAVDAGVGGDFAHRIDLTDKQGFGFEIGVSINTLNANLQGLIGGNPAEAVAVANRIASGDLDVAVPVREGDDASILAAMAKMRDRLVAVIAEIEAVVDAAAAGDFSRRMVADDKQGYSLRLCELLNRLSDLTENGLQDAIDVAQAIACGDLTQKIESDYPGRFGELKDAINTTVDRLQEMIRRVQDASSAIDTAAREIAQGNQDLSRRTEEAAIDLQRTAASMDELNATVHRNSDRADEANRLATGASGTVLRGGEMVDHVIVNMRAIQESSRKITDIISVIDSIAFQTNILALNAAVEAARAGEQGRGFAVVAAEVRSLAQRSAQAAREIKTLIESSTDQVDAGSTLVETAGRTMGEVVQSFRTVADLVIEIAQSSKKQSMDIASVTRAVAHMDETTQQNSALVEQAAAAAESLHEQASGMVEALTLFKLETAPRHLRLLASRYAAE